MNIFPQKVSFQSFDGVSNVSGVIYKPDTDNIKGVVQIIHGMAEHILRYDDFAGFLIKNSFVVFGCDHIGHGRSVSSKDDYGYFGHEDGCSVMVEDTRKLSFLVRQKYPDVPFFILGHSMGSFVLRKYITKYSDGLSGVVISGTGGANPLAKIGMTLAKRDVKKNGDRNKSEFLDKMAFGSYNKAIENPKTKFDWLTRDEKIVDEYVQDDACGYIFTSSAFLSLLKIMYDVNTDSWYDEVPKKLPILMISGEEDPVGNYGKGVKKVYEKLREAGIEDLDMILYEGGRHEMLNEINRAQVYDDILGWITKRCEKTRSKVLV